MASADVSLAVAAVDNRVVAVAAVDNRVVAAAAVDNRVVAVAAVDNRVAAAAVVDNRVALVVAVVADIVGRAVADYSMVDCHYLVDTVVTCFFVPFSKKYNLCMHTNECILA
jgi:hypothetical protein